MPVIAKSGTPRLLRVGQLLATPAVLETVPKPELLAAYKRHMSCDWGDVCKEDWRQNDWALKNAERLLSVYHSSDGTKFWIITEWDRSVTTILLPSDY